MDASKYIEQIKREAKAHPAKAALLAVMCGVLLYVCMPLFAGSGSDKAKPVVKANTKTPVPIAHAQSATPAPVATAKPTVFDWKTIVEEIDADERTRSASRLGISRDPFAPPPEPKIASVDEQPVKKPETRPAVLRKIHFTPSEVGLSLGSTLLGTNRRVAMINGKPYHVYDPKQTNNRRSVVPFASAQQLYAAEQNAKTDNQAAYFVLVDVRPRSVVLWRRDRRHELKLPGIALAEHSPTGARNGQPNPTVPKSALIP